MRILNISYEGIVYIQIYSNNTIIYIFTVLKAELAILLLQISNRRQDEILVAHRRFVARSSLCMILIKATLEICTSWASRSKRVRTIVTSLSRCDSQRKASAIEVGRKTKDFRID